MRSSQLGPLLACCVLLAVSGSVRLALHLEPDDDGGGAARGGGAALALPARVPAPRAGGAAAAAAADAAAAAVAAEAAAAAADAAPRIWLYSLAAADYDGAALLPHFLDHYLRLGISPAHVLLVAHHNPALHPAGAAGLAAVAAAAAARGVATRTWRGAFSVEEHYQRVIALLDEAVPDPYDWVIIADSDELQEWPGYSSIREALAAAAAANASYVNGALVDRLACGGCVRPYPPAGSDLGAAFPLRCRVVANLYDGWDFKVAAFRGYLRSGRGNHKIIAPAAAKKYFGPCPEQKKGAKKVYCPRPRNIFRGVDLYGRTPYARHAARYAPGGGWDAVPWAVGVSIEHFKYHTGVVQSMHDRMVAYSGDCVLNVNEGRCTPALPSWRESAIIYSNLKTSMRLDLTGMNCSASAACAAPVASCVGAAGGGGAAVVK